MKRPLAPVRMLHHLAVLDRLLLQRGSHDAADTAVRRGRQRRQLLVEVLAERSELRLQGGDRFWVVLRWGGCGLLTAEALHHLLPG
jgi:hypothetical protein